MSKPIYADNAATTKLDERAFEAMRPFLLEEYGNASQPYSLARLPKKALQEARESIAACIGADSDEIFFTSGGTESDNWAIKSHSLRPASSTIVTSAFEHHAVLHSCEWMNQRGARTIYVTPQESGHIDVFRLKEALPEGSGLVTIMFANNEIGTIQPIEELAKVAHEQGYIFHTDAVQAVGHIPVNVKDMNIDMLSASGHKFHGPKGTGFLYISNSVKIGSFIHGGSQERSRRAGTLNVPGIIGMAEAARLEAMNMEKNMKYVSGMRDYIIERISADIPYAILNGDRYKRLPGNIHMSFIGAASELLLIMLDQKGICVSAGSACASGSVDPSHVLTAIGVDKNIARNSVRMTIGEDLTKEEADYVVEELKAVVERIRSMSPEYAQFIAKKS